MEKHAVCMGIEPIKRDILPGVKLMAYHTDRFKMGFLSLTMPIPVQREETPAATLLMSVLRRGTEKYPSLELINRRLDELYATPCGVRNGAIGNAQVLGFSAELLEQRFILDDTALTQEVVFLIMQMLCHPIKEENGQFCARYVEAEKKNVSDAVRALINRPGAYALSRFYDIFNEKYAHGHMLCGTVEQIAQISQEQLAEIHHRLLSEAPIHIFYIGGIDPDTLAMQLGETLRTNLPRSFDAPSLPGGYANFALPPLTCDTVRRVDEELAVGQSHLILGYRSGITLGSDDFYAMMLCNEILGASPVSLLFVHVREERSLCYSCSSDYVIDRGDVIISCGIDRSRREEAERAITEQVAAMKNGDFSDVDLEAARALLLATYRQIPDGTKAISSFYATRQLLGVSQTIEDCYHAIREVTREQVIRVAQKLQLDTVYFLCGTENGAQEGADDEE